MKQTGPIRVAELARGLLDAGRAGHAAEVRRAHADPLHGRERLALVVRALLRFRAADHHGHRELAAARRQVVQVVRRLRQDDVDALLLDELEQRVGKGRVRTGWDEMERVAEVAADRTLGHVHADEADLLLAVLAQRPQEPCRSGRAARGDEDRRHACASTQWNCSGPSGDSELDDLVPLDREPRLPDEPRVDLRREAREERLRRRATRPSSPGRRTAPNAASEPATGPEPAVDARRAAARTARAGRG